MTVLVVGGDHVESFARVLQAAGFSRMRHWSGRKAGEHHQAIPQDTELVLMVIDQLNHGLVRSVRAAAEARGLPVIYSPRSRSRLVEALQRVHEHSYGLAFKQRTRRGAEDGAVARQGDRARLYA
ncbi:DUF2325 domain-containing protein [Niveibacterium sp. SC-1]|uniref:DUF2325 domain-containing protein n=1 Tax=Niveibacterium sp. SC-1 TaxID=3135646 RepID=UPI00311E1F3B